MITHKNLSDSTAEMVDREIRRIIDEQYARARKIIEDNREKVEIMAAALLDWETLNADQINDIMAGGKPRPPQGLDGGTPTGADVKPKKPTRKPRVKPSLGDPAGEH